MKKILLILGLLANVNMQAQHTGVTLYGYSQGISKGIRATTVNENGETKTEKKSQGRSYLIYLEVPSGMKLDITELWINGEKYRYKVSPEKTPLELKTGLSMPGQKPTILIPKTEKDLIRLVQSEKIPITGKNKRNIVKNRALVVFYKANGKNGYRSLGKMEVLPDLVNE
ncbi:MAG TPA: hypothetical protein VK166_19865 [Chitinophagaceae bacterium]|nr:hypothetical protein [Chitinophagaceae bacterium]